MKRSVYFAFPIVAILVLLISGFGILPRSTQLPAEATPTTTLVPRLGTPVQTPQSRIFTSCPPGGEGRVVTNFQDLKNLPKKDYAKELSPESLASYVATLSDAERVAYLKTLDSEQLVKYAAGLDIKKRESYLESDLKKVTSTSRKEFEADLAEYQQGELYQNELKNRTDPGDYKRMKFQDLLILPPTAAEIRSQIKAPSPWQWGNRGAWDKWQKELVYRYEGLAIKVDGYLFYSPAFSDANRKETIAEVIGAQEMTAESTNCFFTTPDLVDWHLTFTGNRQEPDRSKAIVVEVTPRIRASYSKGTSTWTIDKLTVIAKKQYRIRISGWLFFDPEHSGNLPGTKNVSRGTLWEIHPVMRIFMKLKDDDTSPWIPLEKCNLNTHNTDDRADDTLTCDERDRDWSESLKIIK